MAASGGYQCDFVGAVSEDFVCGICKHVAREPHLTGCCGETFCKACITPVLEDKKPCPSCQKINEFKTVPYVKYQQRILALEVRCTMKDRGCEWTGKLEGLEAHLDVNTGDCEYVDVECPNKCDQAVEKRKLTTHLTDSCPKREFICRHCNFKATYEVVSNDHWPQCSFYPVPCPNACGIQAIERGDLDAHLLQCPLEEVECTFLHAGCNNTKLPRQDMEKHMEESTQKHLALMSEMNLRVQRYTEQMNRETAEKFRQMQGALDKKQQQIDALEQKSQQSLQTTSQEFERKLDDQVRQAAEVAEQLQEKTRESEAKIRNLRSQLQQKARQVELLHDHMTTARICSSPSTNIIFEMPDFNKYLFDKYCKDEKEYWHSPPMYTHACGYKFRITVWLGASHVLQRGKHMAVYLDALKGEFDGQLKWPAKWTMVLHVLNREWDQDHISVSETFSWDKPTEERFRVKYFGMYEASIAHGTLQFVTSQKQYLKDNTLLFKLELNETVH